MGLLDRFIKSHEAREDRLERLANDVRAMTEEEFRRFIKRARPGFHAANNPKRKRKVESNAE